MALEKTQRRRRRRKGEEGDEKEKKEEKEKRYLRSKRQEPRANPSLTGIRERGWLDHRFTSSLEEDSHPIPSYLIPCLVDREMEMETETVNN